MSWSKTTTGQNDWQPSRQTNHSLTKKPKPSMWHMTLSQKQLHSLCHCVAQFSVLLLETCQYTILANKTACKERPPIVELITSTESAIVHANLEESKAEELRHKVCSILVNSKPPPQNISQSERKALNDLSHDKNIVNLPADKGKCTVVLKSADYESKCDELLKDCSVYKLLG